MSDTIQVVAAVIRREGRVLLGRRFADAHLGGLWELPGGKVEPGESLPDALAREIAEEIGVAVRVGERFLELQHEYPERTVHLNFFLCDILAGTPQALGVAEIVWVPASGLDRYAFPEANREVVRKLQSLGP